MATPIHPKTANQAPVAQATQDSTAIIQVIERAALNPEVESAARDHPLSLNYSPQAAEIQTSSVRVDPVDWT